MRTKLAKGNDSMAGGSCTGTFRVILMSVPVLLICSVRKTENWKPASIFVDDNEVLCFVIDETEDYCSIFLPSSPSPLHQAALL
jgi:hypothetical protein